MVFCSPGVCRRFTPDDSVFSTSALPALDAWRPMWLLHCMVAIIAFEGVMAGVEVWLWPVPTSLRWLQVALEVPAAALLLWLAVRWGLIQSLKIRLLAMLHGGFFWLGITLALQAVSHSLMALSQASTGLAPTHAMTMISGATLLAGNPRCQWS
ncbi:MAG: NnrS family protein [Polaromonas sp.]|nr:NnrS family protein [Polaromonas sp.]